MVHRVVSIMAALAVAFPISIAAQQLEEVVVTARKRAENLLEVPLSITALTGADIERSGIDSVMDVADQTPGLSFNPAFGRVGSGQGGGSSNRPTMRGQPNILGTPNVGFFVDGVFVSGNITSYQLDNLERIEVIRGPQSALFGRGTFAGAVNFVTRRPGEEFLGKVEATVADHEHYEVTGYVSGPLIEGTLAGELNGRWYDRGGDYFNRASGDDDGGEESTRSVGAKLFWTPTEQFELEFNAGFSKDVDGWFPAVYSGRNCLEPPVVGSFFGIFPIIGTRSTGYFCGEIDVDDRDDYFMRTDILKAVGRDGVDRETFRSSVNATLDLAGGWSLNGIAAYNEFRNEQSFDSNLDNGEATLRPAVSITQDRRKDWSAEFRIDSPRDRRVHFLAGAYLYNEQDGAGYRGSLSLPPGPIPLGAANITPDLLAFFPTQNDSEVQNWSVFGLVEFAVNDRLDLTFEARYQVDTITDDQFTETAGNPLLEEDFNAFLPRATALYQLNDRWNLFGNIAKGNKPGGFNGLPDDADAASRALLEGTLQSFEEEEAWTYEVGIKGTNAQGNLSLSTSVYLIDWERQQLTLPFSYTNDQGEPDASTAIQNAGETRVTGLEVDLNYQATDNLNLRLVYSYIDSEIRDFLDPVTEDLFDTDGLVGPFDMAGDPTGQVAGAQAPQTPENKATLTGTYMWPMANGMSWFVRGDVAYESKRFAQVHNLAHTGERTLVNLRTGFESDNWTVTLWAENLFDDRTPLSITRLLNFTTPLFRPGTLPSQGIQFSFYRDMFVTLPRKRTYGITANYKF